MFASDILNDTGKVNFTETFLKMKLDSINNIHKISKWFQKLNYIKSKHVAKEGPEEIGISLVTLK